MAEERKILLSLNLDTVQAVKNQAELKRLLKESNVELSKASIGSAEYKKLETAQGLLQNRLKGLQQATKQSNSELNVQSGSLRDLQNQYAALTRALREAKPGSDVLGLSFEDAKKKAFGLKQEIKSFEEQLGNTAPNVGNYAESFRNAAGGVKVFGTSLGDLFKLVATNPIGALIASLGLLVKMLMSNDTIATALKGVMTGLGIAFDQVSAFVSDAVLSLSSFLAGSSKTAQVIKEVLVRALNSLLSPITYLIDLIPALNAVLEKDFSKAADIAKDASIKFGKSITGLNNEVPKFVTNLKDAANAGLEYEKSLDAIEAKQSELNVTTQALINQRDKLKIQSGDLTKSEEERIALSEKAEAIDKKILSERLALLNEEIKAQEKYTESLGKDSIKREEAEFRLNDLLVKRLEFENESLKFQEKLQAKRNAIIEKQLEDQAKLTKQQEEERAKREKEELELAEKIKDSENKLQQFRLNEVAKRAKTIDERLKAELAAEDFRVKVLLDNEKLLASEKEFILADSAARRLDMQIAADRASLDQTKKTEAERKAAIQQANDQIISYTNQTASILQSINQTVLNSQLTELERKKNQELKIAGKNAKERERIEAEYDAKKEALEKKAARRANDIALIQALINTALSVTKALGSAPPPANFVLAALNAAAGAAQVAAIISQNNKLADGGIIKMMKFAMGGKMNVGQRGPVKNYGKAARGFMIGGKPHSMGGTKFYGEDGTRFEAEKDELLTIVNKRDTPLLKHLSDVNSIHGKAFYRDGGIHGKTYLTDGGFAARANTSQIESSLSAKNSLMDVVSSMPSPRVLVDDINKGQFDQVKVRSRADI
jgi:hypothetical protein